MGVPICHSRPRTTGMATAICKREGITKVEFRPSSRCFFESIRITRMGIGLIRTYHNNLIKFPILLRYPESLYSPQHSNGLQTSFRRNKPLMSDETGDLQGRNRKPRRFSFLHYQNGSWAIVNNIIYQQGALEIYKYRMDFLRFSFS